MESRGARRLKMFQSASKVQCNHSQGSRQGQLLHGLWGFESVDFTSPFLCLWNKACSKSSFWSGGDIYCRALLYCCVIQWRRWEEWPSSRDLCSLRETAADTVKGLSAQRAREKMSGDLWLTLACIRVRWSQVALVGCSEQPFLSAKLSFPYYFILDFCSLWRSI